MAHSEGNLSSLKSINLTLTGLNLDTSDDGSKKGKKATKALLSELEQLMEVLQEAKSTGSSDSSAKILSLLKGVASGSSADNSEVLKALVEFIKKDGGNIDSLMKLAQESLEDTPASKQVKAYLDDAKKNFSKVTDAIGNGDTSLEEILEEGGMQAFIGGFLGNVDADKKGALGATDTNKADPKAKKEETHEQKMVAFAVALSSLLSDIYNEQVNQGNQSSSELKDQMTSLQATSQQRIKDLQSEMSKQSQATSKPWYMYLIAAVVAVVGAVIAFFTAGAGAAVVGLVIAAIMMSPIGDKLTAALVKAFIGNNPNPTDAQKTGAQIGATAVITVITALLSMGGSAVTSVAEGATEGAADGMADGLASGGSSIARSASIEMTEMSSTTLVEEGAEGATEGTEQAAGEELIGDLEDALEDVEDSGDDASEGVSKKGKNPFGKLRFKKAALTEGLGKRLGANLIIGFLGSGGLQEIMQLFGDAFPKSNYKKWLDSDVGSIVMGVLEAAVAIGGSLVASKYMAEPGEELRTKALKGLGCEDSQLEMSPALKWSLKGILIAAQAAAAGVGINKFMQFKDAAALMAVLGNDTASMQVQGYGLQSLNAAQSAMNGGFTKEEEDISSSMQEVLDSIGSMGKQTAQKMSS